MNMKLLKAVVKQEGAKGWQLFSVSRWNKEDGLRRSMMLKRNLPKKEQGYLLG